MMRFPKFQRGEPSSDSDDYGYLGESSKQAERRFRHSSKNHLRSKSGSKSFTYKNTAYKNNVYKNTANKKNTAYKSTSSNVFRKQMRLSRSSSDRYGFTRKKRFHGQRDNLHEEDHKRRKLHNGAVFVEDPDFIMYLESLAGDKGKDKDDSESETESEDHDDVVDDEENEDIHEDMDSGMDMDMGGNWMGVGNELNPDASIEEDVEENEDVQVDMNMGGDSGEGIDVGDEQDPDYKLFFENLREDGKSYILEMVTEKGDFVSIKYEEPLVPPSCYKGKSMPVDGFHPFLEEFKPELTSTADESYIKYFKSIGVMGGSLFVITDDIIPPVGEPNKVTPSVPKKSSKDGFRCGKDLQFKEDNKDSIPRKSAKDGLGYCKDPVKKPRKPQKSYDSQMDEDDLVTECPRSEFEKRLEKCINMPYDEKELADKWKLASYRDEVARVRETRGRSVSYATEQTGRSYLDHHPALAEMVDCALARRDGCRALLLLRCLFFYNENVAHEGAFLPWKDRSFERMLLDSA
ncbi:hypothetical protein MKW94_024371 [Papaver nudicaule]|uniref:Uncharacterized protein n=1 Tax=Papaver nudicaule TaxID=74823 RepID=A0AA41S2Q2_PAPNU|nr:hypothetical protein [Papaver nudicaule]